MRCVMVKKAFLSILLLICSSCVASGFIRPEAEGLEEAVKIYWEGRVRNDPKACYAYENMSLDKRFDEQYYTENFLNYKIVIHNFEIIEIGKEGTGLKGTTPVRLRMTRTVHVDIGIMKKPNTATVEVVDYWIKREDGRWYHLIQGISPGQFN